MKRNIIIGIDAGTSVIKSVAFTTTGRQIAVASRVNEYKTLANGGVEQNMRRTWEDTAATLRELNQTVPHLDQRVLSLAVTGQGDGTWLIDKNGEPIHDAWIWLDGRAVKEADELARQARSSSAHEVIYTHSGTGVTVCQMRTHFKWMQKHAPDLLRKAATALHCKDWLYFNLCGQLATDPSEGCFTFGDFRQRDYSEEVIDALGVSELKHLLPPIVDGVSEAGSLSVKAARETGLPQGLPISLAYVDVLCCALGGGMCDPVVKPGLTILGSTGMHMRFVEHASEVCLNDGQTGYTMAFPDGGYAQMQSNMAATLNIDWLLDIGLDVLTIEGVKRNRCDLIKHLDDAVFKAAPGSALFHPYISSAGERGPFINPAARASLTGLDQTHGYFDLMRSVYEGLAFAARDCYTAMGSMPDEIRLSGGAARSNALGTIIAATLNVPVRHIHREEAGAAGAAMISAVQQGIFNNISESVTSWVTPLLAELETPDAELASQYDNLFKLYIATQKSMVPLWDSLASIRKGTTL